MKDTIVLHTGPDLEALFMVWIPARFEWARRIHEIIDTFEILFKPSGFRADEEFAKRHLCLDCGGGSVDQHGKSDGRSSLDRQVELIGFDKKLPEMMDVVRLISENDLTGQEICRDRTYQESATPHTPRHLRNLIFGWNLLYPHGPLKVAHLAFAAFDGIWKLIEREAVDEVPWEERLGSDVFLCDNIVIGVDALFERGDIEICSAAFRQEANAAFQALEQDWTLAEKDVRKASVYHFNTEVRRRDGIKMRRNIAVTFGPSETERYSAVCRLRHRADVTVQFRQNGRFMVSSKGIDLTAVARVLRAWDLHLKGFVRLSSAEMERLSQPGHVTVRDPVTGREGEAIYFAEFLTCFGNAFRTNPSAPATALTPGEIKTLVLQALQA